MQFFLLGSGGLFVQCSQTVCEKFENQWLRRRMMLFKDIPYQALWWPLCSAERNHLCSFGPGGYEEFICEIILNL